MSEMIRVGMADYRICRAPQRIITLGLGSCLGVVLFDPSTKLCGMAHIMMPDSTRITKNTNRMKFADTCMEDMFQDLIASGVNQRCMYAKLAGGAKMFSRGVDNEMLNIGEQNIEAVHGILQDLRIPVMAEDVGKTYGRTIEFDTSTGELFIKSVGIGDSVI